MCGGTVRLTIRQLKTVLNEALKWHKPRKGEQAKLPGMHTSDPRRLVSWDVDEELGDLTNELARQAAKAIKQEMGDRVHNADAVFRRGWIWVPTWKHVSPLQYGLAAASNAVVGYDVFTFDVRPPWKVSREKRKLINQMD